MSGSALFGRTGFVGGNLLAQLPFDHAFRSTDAAASAGQDYDLVVFSAAKAEKWRINQDPDTDLAHIRELEALLAGFTTRRLVLISTVDVYPDPIGVDEATEIETAGLHPYGAHRLRLEETARRLHPTTVVRLPGLFGTGIKKNVIYDLLHDNNVDRLHPDARIQYYDLARLGDDLRIALDAGLDLVNLATEPIATSELADRVFSRRLEVAPVGVRPVAYDVRSRHAAAFAGRSRYVESREQVLARLSAFVGRERRP